MFHRSLRQMVASVRIDRRNADQPRITGYGAPFYNPQDTGTQFDAGFAVERIERNAFDQVLNSDEDVVMLFNHDGGTLLGRRSAGTLDLSVDSFGLRFAVPYDEGDPDHVRVGRKIEKGELGGASIGFDNAVDDWTVEQGRRVRTLKQVRLGEVSVVAFPAYKATSAALRNEVRSAWEQRSAHRGSYYRARAMALDI